MLKVIEKPALLAHGTCHDSFMAPSISPGRSPNMQNIGSRATELTPFTGGVKTPIAEQD